MSSLVGVKVGDKIMVPDRTGRQGIYSMPDYSKYVEHEVTKVGRKYVTIMVRPGPGGEVQYSIENGAEHSQYTGYGPAFTIQAFAELPARQVAMDILRSVGVEFRGNTAAGLTLVQLQKIGLVMTGDM